MKILDKIYAIWVGIHIKFPPEMTLQSSTEININLIWSSIKQFDYFLISTNNLIIYYRSVTVV